MKTTTLFTIGFTQKCAREFFEILERNHVKRVIDIRLNNVSQLAGFSKRDDLAYFLREICKCEYLHQPLLAPTKALLDDYKNKQIDWPEYEKRFKSLLIARGAHNLLSLSDLVMSCLLCSEPKPDNCHRRLVAEYFQHHIGGLKIQHL